MACRFGPRRLSGAVMKAGWQYPPQKWWILVVSGEIYRSAGARSNPVAPRRFRILCLFSKFGLAPRLGYGGGRRSGATNEGLLPSLTRLWRIPLVKGEIYRSVGISSYPRAMMRPRKLAGVSKERGKYHPRIPRNEVPGLQYENVATHFGIATGARFLFGRCVAALYRFYYDI